MRHQVKAALLTSRPDQRAIETLLSLAETYGGHGKDIAAQSTGAVKDAHADDSLTTAETDLKVCCINSVYICDASCSPH